MTPDEARDLVIEGINYAAYRETDFSLHDSDKNRLFGSKHYASGGPVYEPSPWAEGDSEGMMATPLVWAGLLESEDSVVGRVIQRAKNGKTTNIAPADKSRRS